MIIAFISLFGPDLLIVVCAILLVLVIVSFAARNRVVPLVIKRWYASNTPNPTGHYVVIVGRREGLVSWILALVGIDATTSITVSGARIEFEEASLSGRTKRLIPLTSVCSTLYGYAKPWKKALIIMFIVGALVVFGSGLFSGQSPGFGSFVLGLLLGFGAGALHYVLNRQFTLGFVEDSGVVSSIRFKRSIVENQEINEVQASYVSEVTQALIESTKLSLVAPRT
ncbi:MAG TPA: hypothetical protein VGO11_06105 [Chthoniobacteraceae bacterium]|jgi:hypothetical protein|nr:hypothetical protein [Chthoniobacteraceae bacterium]